MRPCSETFDREYTLSCSSMRHSSVCVLKRYILQVFLRLEVDHLCGENLSEHDVSHLAIEVMYYGILIMCN